LQHQTLQKTFRWQDGYKEYDNYLATELPGKVGKKLNKILLANCIEDIGRIRYLFYKHGLQNDPGWMKEMNKLGLLEAAIKGDQDRMDALTLPELKIFP
jgi:hypothetical protein